MNDHCFIKRNDTKYAVLVGSYSNREAAYPSIEIIHPILPNRNEFTVKNYDFLLS